MTCKSAEERVKALKRHFEIELTGEEFNGIKVRSVELLGGN